MSRFFLFFCGKLVVVICFMLVIAITIKDLPLRSNNKELPTMKSAIWFESTCQKKLTGIKILVTQARLETNLPDTHNKRLYLD